MECIKEHKHLKSREPGKPKVYSVSNVIQFIEVVISLENRVFRGQTKEEGWPLVPSAGRNLNRSLVLKKEKEILEEFKRESIPYIDFVPKNNWQWLALAQHNRLPTRLLDWTKNPLAALWFAVKDSAIEKNPGIVWVYRYEESEAIRDTSAPGIEDPFLIDQTYLYFPEHVFPSIQAQSSVFTVHYRERKDSDTFPPFEQIKNADLRLSKIEIEPGEPALFRSIQYELFRIGISPASLFPGLEGIAERISYDNILYEDEFKVETGN
jgi:hypothetical protein